MREASPTDKTSTELPPAMVGRYQLERQLGQGGMGQVYLAKDTLLHRLVALKRLFAESASDPAVRKRILVEAQKASRVNDPRIASVYDVFEDGNELVLVMEYVEGRTLREHVKERTTLEDFWNIAEQCLDAFESAHREGIIHRDIKPDNVMVTPEGGIKILDFGLARAYPLADATTLTSTQSADQGLRGTPPYMPPEMLLGQPADARGDVFSLGVTFYELLAGFRPFDGRDRADTYRKILNDVPPSLRQSNPGITEELEIVILRMLAKDPAVRYATMTEVHEAVLAARRGDALPLTAPLIEPAPDSRVGIDHNVRLATVLIGFVAVLAVAGWLAWRSLQKTDLPAYPTLAVLPPVVTGGTPEFEALAFGMIGVLSDDLAPAMNRAETRLIKVKDVLKGEAATSIEAHARVGANLALETSLSSGEKRIQVEQRLIDATTGSVLREKRKEFPADVSPMTVLEVLRVNTGKFLDLGEESRSRKERFGTEGDGSMRFYLEGLGTNLRAKNLEDRSAAQSRFDLAIRTDPRFARAHVALGWVYYDRFQAEKDVSLLEKAREEANAALSIDSQQAEAHKLLGYASSRLGDMKTAENSLAHAQKLDPIDLSTYREWGRFYGRQGKTSDEERIYHLAVATNNYDWRPHFWLASHFYTQGRFDEARASLEEMIRRAPEHYMGYSQLGGVHVLQGHYEEAIRNLDRSISLHPTAEAFSNLGTAYFNLRRMSEAISTYNRSFQFGFENYLLWVNLGDAYRWSAGLEKQAGDTYRQALLLGQKELLERSHRADIRAELARVMACLGDADTARVWIATVVQHSSDNPNIAYCAALTYWELRNTDEALDWLEKAVASGFPRVWLRDSAMFDAWRRNPRFQAIAEEKVS